MGNTAGNSHPHCRKACCVPVINRFIDSDKNAVSAKVFLKKCDKNFILSSFFRAVAEQPHDILSVTSNAE
jgi:hypothetical protein